MQSRYYLDCAFCGNFRNPAKSILPRIPLFLRATMIFIACYHHTLSLSHAAVVYF